jgi:toxin ParE1/3/4
MAGFRLSELAIDDLARIRHYVGADSQTTADKVIAGFFKRFELLADHPQMGAPAEEFAAADLRVHSVGNFLLFYRVIHEGIEIARVLHGAREIGPLLE